MARDREPWIKVKIGIRRSGKLAALPSDSARLGWLYVLVEAKVQRRPGTFDNRAHFVEVLGRFGRFFDHYVEAGLIHVAPALCAECKPRHRDAKRSEIIVHDYLKEQRDPTNADRQADWRERHGDEDDEAEPAPDVTPTVTGSVTANVTPSVTAEVGATVTPDSRARRTTATGTGTRTENEKVPLKPRTRGLNGAGPTLSKSEHQAWSSFGSEWDAFRLAWIGRGFRLPPTGSAEGDDTSQRGLLWSILDNQPTNLVRWIETAPGKTAHDVIAWVLAQWHEVRAEAGAEDVAWLDPDAISRTAAPVALGRIVDELAKRDPA